MRRSPITAGPGSRPRCCRGVLADRIRRIVVGIHLHIVVAARVRVLDGCAWRRRRWPVWTVKTTYIWYAWFMTADVLDIIVGSNDELDKRATGPIVFPKYIRQSHSSVSLRLEVPVLLRAISVPPPDKRVVTLRDPLRGRYCSSNACPYAAAQAEVCSCDLEKR